MYEELVKRLREPCQYENCVLCKDAANAIEEQSVIIESYRNRMRAGCDWIPVTERLPEIGEYVLCTCRAGIVDVFKYVNGIDGPWYKDSRHVYMKGFVTHWQPLPAPPKEDRADG